MNLSTKQLIILSSLGIFGAWYLKKITKLDLTETFSEAIDMIQEINPLASELIIRIDRYLLTDTKTIGRMYINNEFFCHTLEDTYRGQITEASQKVYGATAINNGIYRTVVSYSPKFNKNMPELKNVPFFTGIRIHTGLTEKDTDGCIIVGDYQNNKWTANSQYVQELIALIPQFSLCKTVINVI